MGENLTVSVIVPVYNVEKYLSRCVGSILEQTFTDFELILVDDGSPDKSGELCDKYAKKDSRIKVIHKENGGVSSARNAGLDIAQGKYITFVDSDDWVAKNYLESLFVAIRKNNSDISICGLEKRDVSKWLVSLETRSFDITEISSEEFISLFDKEVFCGPCVKFFDNEIIKKNNLRFKPIIRFGEDAIFVREYLSHCKKICIEDKQIYFYNKLNEKSSTKMFDPEISKWTSFLSESYLNFLNCFNIEINYKNKAISKYAFERFCGCVGCYVQGLSKKEAIEEIEKTYYSFEKYFALKVDSDKAESKNEIEKAICLKNFEQVYKIYYKIINGNKIYKKLSGIKRAILSPILERKRDGLNKYRYLDK